MRRLASSKIPRPPKGWWHEKEKEIKEGNPDYSDDRVRRTIGDIWYNKISESKRKEIKERYYGKKSFHDLAARLGKIASNL